MSVEELSKLSLAETMVTTRAGAARARAAPSQDTQQSASSSEASSPTPSLIVSTNGLQYDVSEFDGDLRKRAKRGLIYEDNDIEMKFCEATEDDPKKYLFHLADDITVAMNGGNTPKCSCGANEDGRACKHIFWMLGQLTSQVQKTQPLQLAKDGSTVRDTRPAELIKKYGFETIAGHLDWPLLEEELPEEEDMVDEIANMLSVFEPTDDLPADFKSDETRDLSSRKYQEFKDLIADHAKKNNGLYIQLQGIIDRAFRARVFFAKIDHRIDRAFDAFQEYIAKGPTRTNAAQVDVKNCANRLKGLVQTIAEYYHEQIEEHPDPEDLATRAGKALLDILDGVADRDFDAYENITWSSEHPTDPKDRNLFVFLIYARPEDEGLFVLDTLQGLPQDGVIRHHWALIQGILEKLNRSNLWTPQEYMDAFRTLYPETRKRAASETGGSSAKRPMQ